MNEKLTALKTKIVDALLEKQGQDVLSMEVSEVTSVADMFIVASGNSGVHMSTLINAVRGVLDSEKIRYTVEGENSDLWTLVDAGDVIVHVFSVRAREFYKLERIWGDVAVEHHN